MKNITFKRLCVALVLLGTGSLGSGATTWDFNNGIPSGWNTDVDYGVQPGRTIIVTFVETLVSTSGGNLLLQSGDRVASGAVQGSGISNNTAFSSNDISTRIRMVPTDTDGITSIPRSQASFWIWPAGLNAHEIDMFEIKPGANYMNYITWEAGVIAKAKGNSTTWGPHSEMTSWTTYRLVRSGTKLTTTRNGGEPKVFAILNGKTVGNRVAFDNKPWLLTSNVANLTGKVATFEVDWIEKK